VELLTDRTKLLTAVGGFSALFLGVYGARESARVVGGAVERWLGTPRLVGALASSGVLGAAGWCLWAGLGNLCALLCAHVLVLAPTDAGA
jgi:hypothetical protein